MVEGRAKVISVDGFDTWVEELRQELYETIVQNGSVPCYDAAGTKLDSVPTLSKLLEVNKAAQKSCR